MYDKYYADMLILDMSDYVKKMVGDFPVRLDRKRSVRTPALENVFNEPKGKPLSKAQAEVFHTFIAKALFLSKRARLDIRPTVSVLCTCVKEPTIFEWDKLLRMMKFLHSTQDKVLRITTSGDLTVLKWMIDASFGVHPLVNAS